MLRRSSKVPGKSFPFLLIVSLFILFQSCAFKSGPGNLEKSADDLEPLFSEVRAKWSNISTLKGYFRISVDLNGKKGSLRAFMTASLPDRFRIEFFTPAGTTEALLVSNGLQIILYYPSEKTLFTGDSSHANLNKILGIDLSPNEIIPIFLGKGADLPQTPVNLRIEDGMLAFDSQLGNAVYKTTVFLDTDENTVKSIVLRQSGNKELFARVTYSDFLHGESYSYPQRMLMEFPQKKTTYKIRILNASFTRSVPEDSFFQVKMEQPIDKLYRLENIKIRGTILFGEN